MLSIRLFCLLLISPIFGAFNFFDASSYNNSPLTLSLLGMYTNIPARTLDPDVKPYDINVSSWNNGMKTEYFYALPAGQTIAWKNDQEFTFPQDMTLIQNIYKDLGNNQRHMLETRLLVLKFDTWYVFPYRWNAAQTDANRAWDFDEKDTTYTFPDGVLNWKLPSENSCWKCHIKKTPQVRSFVPPQLNKVSVHSAGGNQLDFLKAQGVITGAMPAATGLHAWSPSDHATATAEQKARSYLAANCSGCHLPGVLSFYPGQMYGNQDLTYWQPNAGTNYISIVPDNLGVYSPILFPNTFRYIYPQRVDSTLYIHRLDQLEMPPENFATVKDTIGIALLNTWVAGLTPIKLKNKVNLGNPYFQGQLIIIPNELKNPTMYQINGEEIPLNHVTLNHYNTDQKLTEGVYFIKTKHKTFVLTFK